MLRTSSASSRRSIRHFVLARRTAASRAPPVKQAPKTVQTTSAPPPPAPGSGAPPSKSRPVVALALLAIGGGVGFYLYKQRADEEAAAAAKRDAQEAARDAELQAAKAEVAIGGPAGELLADGAFEGDAGVPEHAGGEDGAVDLAALAADADADAEAEEEEETADKAQVGAAGDGASDAEPASGEGATEDVEGGVHAEAEPVQDASEEEPEPAPEAEVEAEVEAEPEVETDPFEAAIKRRTVVVAADEDSVVGAELAAAAEASVSATRSIEDVRLETMRMAAERVSDAMRAEVARSIDAELEGLDGDALRARVHSLAREMHDMQRWEAVRLSESLRQLEESLAERYAALLRAQAEQQAAAHRADRAALRGRLQAALQAELDAQREALVEEARRVVDARVQAITAARMAEVQVAARKAVVEAVTAEAAKTAEAERRAVETLRRTTERFESLRADVMAVHSVFSDHTAYARASHHSHQVALAALALQQRLTEGRSLAPALHVLRAAAAADPFVRAVHSAVPRRAERRGAATREQLSARFLRQMPHVRKAIFRPATKSALGDMLGWLTALFVAPPDVDGPSASWRDAGKAPLVSEGRLLATSAGDGAEEAVEVEVGAAEAVTEGEDGAGAHAGEAGAEREEAMPGTEAGGENAVDVEAEAEAEADAEAEARRAEWERRAREEALRVWREEHEQKQARVQSRRDSDVRLHRAAALLRDNKLSDAVAVAELIDGQAGEELRPWLRDAKERLAVELAARALRAHSTCLAAELN